MLGQYQAAINEGGKVKPRDEFGVIERDVFVYRAFIEQGNFQVVLDELKGENVSPPLQAVRLLASFLSGKIEAEKTIEQADAWLRDPDFAQDDMVLFILAITYERLGVLQKAMQCVFNNKLLEAHALVIELLLQLRRPDLAEKELREMQKVQEFAIPTLLATAWVNLALGGDKIKEACLTFEDIGKKYGACFAALHGVGVCKLAMQKYTESEESLLRALEKNPKSVETLVSLIVVTQMLGKMEDNNRFQAQLRSVSPQHPSLHRTAELSEVFDKHASEFA